MPDKKVATTAFHADLVFDEHKHIDREHLVNAMTQVIDTILKKRGCAACGLAGFDPRLRDDAVINIAVRLAEPVSAATPNLVSAHIRSIG